MPAVLLRIGAREVAARTTAGQRGVPFGPDPARRLASRGGTALAKPESPCVQTERCTAGHGADPRLPALLREHEGRDVAFFLAARTRASSLQGDLMADDIRVTEIDPVRRQMLGGAIAAAAFAGASTLMPRPL